MTYFDTFLKLYVASWELEWFHILEKHLILFMVIREKVQPQTQTKTLWFFWLHGISQELFLFV